MRIANAANQAQPNANRMIPLQRRRPAPHPGPVIASDFLDPLGLDAAAFAVLAGIDATRLDAMLSGTTSIDVDAAVRFGRCLGLSAERIMLAQARYDFAVSRSVEHRMPRPATDVLAHVKLPSNALHGHLTRALRTEGRESLFFVADELGLGYDGFERAHALGIGDRLRIYGSNGRPVWGGAVLQDFDEGWLFAFATRPEWQEWFAHEARAEYLPHASAT